MTDKQTIEALREYPEGQGLDGTYYAMAMFLTGVDLGRSNGMLRGFTEWLVVRRGELSPFYWHKLVLLELFPDMKVGGWKNPDHLTPEQHRQAVDHLLSLILEFLETRNAWGEMGRMYTQYHAMHAHITG